MIKQFLTLTAVTLSLASFEPAFADKHGDGDHKHMKEKLKEMSPEDRKAFHEERKAKWDGMNKDEKLEIIEKKRSEKRAKMDSKWESMSDDEKITFVEERRAKKQERRKENRRNKAKDSE